MIFDTAFDATKPSGIHEGVPDHIYHGLDGISSTGLKQMLVSPAHYRMRKDGNFDSESMRFGRLFHLALLEPARYDVETVQKPTTINRRTKAGRLEWAAFEEDVRRRAKMVITIQDQRKLENMQEACAKSSRLQWLLSGAKTEVSAFLPRTEGADLNLTILRKARADVLQGDVIGDIKTITKASGDECLRAVRKYGYHISAAWYSDIFTWLGCQITAFVIAFIESEPPYGIRIFEISPEMIGIGRVEYEKAFLSYVWCCKTNLWPCYEDMIDTLEFPSSFRKKYDDNIAGYLVTRSTGF